MGKKVFFRKKKFTKTNKTLNLVYKANRDLQIQVYVFAICGYMIYTFSLCL